jgi:hypothetical protein
MMRRLANRRNESRGDYSFLIAATQEKGAGLAAPRPCLDQNGWTQPSAFISSGTTVL